MANYKLSMVAKEDLIRIHHYGVKTFGLKQADKYFNSFFVHFELIAKTHNHLNPLTLSNLVIDVAYVVLTAYFTK